MNEKVNEPMNLFKVLESSRWSTVKLFLHLVQRRNLDTNEVLYKPTDKTEQQVLSRLYKEFFECITLYRLGVLL